MTAAFCHFGSFSKLEGRSRMKSRWYPTRASVSQHCTQAAKAATALWSQRKIEQSAIPNPATEPANNGANPVKSRPDQVPKRHSKPKMTAMLTYPGANEHP